MASVTSQLIEEVTAHAQSDSLEDAREICADGTSFPNNLRIIQGVYSLHSKYLNNNNLSFVSRPQLVLKVQNGGSSITSSP